MTGERVTATGAKYFLTKLALCLCGLALACLMTQRPLVPEILTRLGGAEVITILKREWVMNGWIKFPEDKACVVTPRDIRILAAVDPLTMDAAVGGDTHTFNIAIPAFTSRIHAAVLRELIDAGGVPDWILLGLLPTWRFQREVVSWLDQQFFNRNAFKARRAEPGILVWGLKDGQRIHVIDQSSAITEARLSQETFLNINTNQDPACSKIFEIADQHAITALVISAPVRPVKLTRSPETKSDAVAVGDGLERVRFSLRYFDLPVLPASHFADDVNLNNHGAGVFLRWSAEEFAGIRQAGKKGGIGE